MVNEQMDLKRRQFPMGHSQSASVLGMLAGAAASAPLALSLGHPRFSVALGITIGMAYAVGTRRTPQAQIRRSS
jgi:hypothetical protein